MLVHASLRRSTRRFRQISSPGWPPRSPRYPRVLSTHWSDLRDLEEPLAVALLDEALGSGLQQLGGALDAWEATPGIDGIATLAQLAEAVFAPSRNAGFTDRRGNPVESPYAAWIQASDRAAAGWAQSPARRQDFDAARRAVLDAWLATTPSGELAERRVHGFVGLVLGSAVDHLDQHVDQGDVDAWATNLDDVLAEGVRQPRLVATVQWVNALGDDPTTRSALAGWLRNLAESPSSVHAVYASLSGRKDSAWSTVTEALASGIGPNSTDSALFLGLEFLEQSDAVVHDSIVRAFAREGDESPAEAMIAVAHRLHREDPTATVPMTDAEHASVFESIRAVATDHDLYLPLLTEVLERR